MFALERAIGWNHHQPMFLLNPPWALPIISLLAALPYHAARVSWLFVSLLLETISALALWRYFGGSRTKQWMALGLVATFLPIGAAEQMGQITPLMLVGLTAFLFALRRQHYVLAGASLLLLGFKPHLVYLVVLAIVLWSAESRKWSLAISALCSYAAATLAAIRYNPNVLAYFHHSTQAALDTSCGVGGALRSIFGIQHTWLQFVPSAVGVAWFTLYWARHRRAWRWEDRLPLLLLVSIATAPYAWAHDYMLALPSFVALTVALARTRTDWLVPSATYLVVQHLLFVTLASSPKPWVTTASLLWLVIYQVGVSSLATAGERESTRETLVLSLNQAASHTT
jgi:hypothetical protein